MYVPFSDTCSCTKIRKFLWSLVLKISVFWRVALCSVIDIDHINLHVHNFLLPATMEVCFGCHVLIRDTSGWGKNTLCVLYNNHMHKAEGS